MDSITLLIVLLADFTQKLKTLVLNKTQRICKLALSIVLTSIFTITGMAIPGTTITTAWASEASSLNQILSLKQVKNILGGPKSFAYSMISGSSFLPDLNIFRLEKLNIDAKINFPTTNIVEQRSLFGSVPLYASLMGGVSALSGNSLARFDFFLTIRELNLIQINVNQPR